MSASASLEWDIWSMKLVGSLEFEVNHSFESPKLGRVLVSGRADLKW